MSQSEERIAGPAAMAGDAAKPCARDENLRFTPLRSYVSKARTLSHDAKSDPSLSRLVPAARLQS